MNRLWAKVNKTDTCWLWTASKNQWGYGHIYFDGKQRLAHRVIYELAKGKIPSGLELDHLCRNPACVNPDHLEPVTHQENIKRGLSGQRNKYCRRGIHEKTLENVSVWGNIWFCKPCRKTYYKRRKLQTKIRGK